MDETQVEYEAADVRTRRVSRPQRWASSPTHVRSTAVGNLNEDYGHQLREPKSLPTDAGDAILKLARALARQAAREDHARQQARSACNAETRRDLCEILHRSAK